MDGPRLTLHLLTERYAVSQLPAHSPIPTWAGAAQGFVSITRRPAATQSDAGGELSLVTLESAVPPAVKSQGGWRMLELEGPFDFALTGILLSVLRPLAEAGVGIFAISTFDTDLVLVQDRHVATAVEALRAAGHRIGGSQGSPS